MSAARPDRGYPESWEDWSCPTCGETSQQPCRTRSGVDKVLPHLRRLALAAAGWLAVRAAAGMDADDRLRLARALLDGGPVTGRAARRVAEGGGHAAPDQDGLWRPVIDRFAGMAAVQGELADYVPVVIRLDTHQVRARLRDDADMLTRAWSAAELLDAGDLPDRLRTGERPWWSLTPEQVLELVEVQELLRLLPVVRRRRRHAELLAPPRLADRPLWEVTYARENGVFEAVLAGTVDDEPAGTRAGGHRPGGELRRLIGVGDVPAVVEDLLRQCSVPAGSPVRIRWVSDDSTSRPGIPRRQATVWEQPDLPADQEERARVIAGSPQRMAEMAAALDQLRADLDPADVAAHLVEAARRAKAEQPSTPPIELGAAGGECLVLEERAARAVSWDWVDPAAIVNAGSRPWGEFGSHRPEQMALVTRRLLTAPDPTSAAVRTFAEEPMQLDRVQGPAGPIYEVGSNGLHRSHLGRLLPLPWVFADIRVIPLPATVRPYRKHEEQLTGLWRGLLRRGLVAGHLTTEPVVRLELDWAAAPWLLTTAETACAINQAYERVYPGAWEAVGVPAGTAADPQRWTAWLTAS